MKKFKFTVNGREYDVEVKSYVGEDAEVLVNGTEYNVKVQPEKEEAKRAVAAPKPRPAAAPAETTAAAPAKSSGNGFKAVAPLPGTILSINVNVGDAVKRGDNLLVYEAMKMENNFLAEVDGTIKEINVKVGDNVLQGAVLFVID